MLVGFLTLIKHDSILFSVSKGNDSDALALIDKIYSKKEDREKILRVLKTEVKPSE